MTSDRIDLIRLARTDGIGPVNFRRLLARHGNARAALDALPHDVARAGRQALHVPTIVHIEDEIAATARLGGRLIVWGDPDYPALLSDINDAPPVLSVMGNAALLSTPGIGIVGARNASAAGIRMSEALAAGLAGAGLCVVSGLARGIDAAAHRASLHAGLTVAAIAGGLDRVYPSEHAALQAEIAEKGCLVTEAPLGTTPQSRHFPRRNRLIAGITLGSVIVEAAFHSGTLITARLAQSYGRELFAVPGSPLDPRSRGSNALLRDGAILTETVSDILAHLPGHGVSGLSRPSNGPAPHAPYTVASLTPARKPPPDRPPPSEKALEHVRELLSPTPIPVDDIVSRCQFSVSVVVAALSELELGGFAALLPGGQVVSLPQERQ
ncbi:DNA-processing protein DprA [Acetobacteraceae bacterium LMG 32668]|uniref:DNA-processing protein DprA n=2 Tax=Brytella acorum TaxID=2959299 RepID=A0AA35XX47_9PROT|nr:DNA-processing protein DprA [Brytella acorum]MDF3623667.1 DNA-processing protein DprA [Brytella acorum]CAI9119915.1 DNA-processing protein DprA [Brytella acorum]